MEKQNDIPQLRFPEFDGEWKIKRLGEITYKVGKKNTNNIKYPIYSINNKEGFLPQADQFEGMDSNDRGYDISLYKVIDENTFAYNPARINVGSIGFSSQLHNVIISSLYVCFKTTELVNDNFLLHYLKTSKFNKSVLRSVEGGVREYLFYENFSNIKLYLPTLSEQARIASFFSVLDKKNAELKQKKTLLEQYKRGVMHKIFSQELRFKDINGKEFPMWEKKQLGQIAESIQSGKDKAEIEGSYPLYGSTGVIGKSSNFTYDGKLILIARVGANAGAVNIVCDKFCVSDNTLVFISKKEINIDFCYYLLINQNINKLVFGSGQPLITAGLLKSLSINLPTLNEQIKIANFLTAIDEKINHTHTQIQQTQVYKKGLLQNMFC